MRQNPPPKTYKIPSKKTPGQGPTYNLFLSTKPGHELRLLAMPSQRVHLSNNIPRFDITITIHFIDHFEFILVIPKTITPKNLT